MLVEDDADTCEALSRILRRRGYEVDCARSIAEATAKLGEGPCCMLLDLTLPDGSGIELLRQVRAARLPVRVAIATGSADTELMSDVILLRPDAFFTKPIDVAEVLSWLASQPQG